MPRNHTKNLLNGYLHPNVRKSDSAAGLGRARKSVPEKHFLNSFEIGGSQTALINANPVVTSYPTKHPPSQDDKLFKHLKIIGKTIPNNPIICFLEQT